MPLSLSNDGVDLATATPKLAAEPRGVWRRLTKESARSSTTEFVVEAWSLEEPQMATSERWDGKVAEAGLEGGCMAGAVATDVAWRLFWVCAAS